MLTSSTLRLVPTTQEDLVQIYHWTMTSETTMLWTNRRTIPVFGHFVEEMDWRLRHSILTQLMIERHDDQQKLGLIYAYDAHLDDGYVFVTLFLDQPYTHQGYGAEASCLFLDYLFAYYPLRKVYTDVYSYNERSLHLMRSAGLHEEGCFKEHRWFNGAYADMYRFALYQQEWSAVRARYQAYREQFNQAMGIASPTEKHLYS